MIVTCPNCETSYNLPDEKVPAGGAKVKCSKCAHVFKVELPPATPEEEVEALLEDNERGVDTAAGEDFDKTFDDVAAGDAEVAAEAAEVAGAPDEEEFPASDAADEIVEEMPDTDDLFEEEAPAADGVEVPAEAEDDLFADLGGGKDEESDDLFAEEEDVEDAESDGLFVDEGERGDDLFADEGDEDDGDLFEDADEAEIDDSRALFPSEDEGDEAAADLGGSLELDEKSKPGSSKSLGCLIVLLILAVAIGAAIYFRVWTFAGVNLGAMLKDVPFVGQLFAEDNGGEAPAPGESPAERVRKIELKNVKQYYVANEKVGNLFVVEGKAVNKFSKPKERVEVEVVLYDAGNNVLTSQSLLCGNVLSQFQLQVQSENEIKEGLASDVGILSNNTFIRPGASTPFMAVFFEPPAGVKEFLVKVVDVSDPK
ncbi:DUF3426 domain-containing protein [Pseudodesulfovibrio thermohalotolerans]|uniref:DUF3426 domain-containing protein n=1 Tax=Pseudodesulfovibrio thermohalotolerans TaxID=2880651 RepID=UPI0024412D22|nr:DUF3426 domain-containing protein [Pseudodesulfovibrio thermohalotolerans]WFS62793.1 DUF3426 domain-containing protein [Pseudodesulfovibrio thermohalotolerans]